jgi:DNA-binding NarL/FixJ family response regulator
VLDENAYLPVSPREQLSRRELEVLEMAARGLTNSQVGAQLNVSVHAVKFHLASIYRKLHVANRTEAAVAFWRSEHERTAPAGDGA